VTPLNTDNLDSEGLNIDIDFLIIKLQREPVDIRRVNLYIIANFGEQRLSVDGVTIQFGLKRGQLRLRLKNGIIPIESVDTSQFINFQVDLTGGTENNICWIFQYRSQESTFLKGLINKIKLGTVVKSMQQKNLQGTVNLDDRGICSVEATFEVSAVTDVYIKIEQDSSNLQNQLFAVLLNRTKKKKAVAERLILKYLKPLLEPCILQGKFDV
jgi:hypothetical protein